MASPLAKYRFINAKLRARLSKIISDEFLSQLIRAHSLVEAIQLFQNSDFDFIEGIFTKTGDLKSVELELYKREINLYVEIEKYVKDEVLTFVRALADAFEIENLKNALRLWFDRTIRKRDISIPYLYLYRDRIHYNLKIDDIVGAESIDEIISIIATTPDAEIIGKAKNWLIERKSIFLAEVLLDRHFYKNVLQEIEHLEGRDQMIAKRFIGVEIDLQNIDWLVRFKTMYNLPMEEVLQYALPFGFAITPEKITSMYHSQNVQEILSGFLKKSYQGLETLLSTQGQESISRHVIIERILEHIMMYEVSKTLCGYPFTIGIVLAYFILKRNEIRQIMTVLNAKYYEIQEERIKSRL
jgi:V/A-type H+-transporting ATPase subunit C